MSSTAQHPASESQQQQPLPGFAGFSEELGLDQLPSGASALTAKEVKFVCALLRHGQQRQAAIEAGYSEQSADQIASELLRKPRVKGFYRRCLEQLGTDTAQAVQRIEERARMYHAKAIEAGQAVRELDELILQSGKIEKGDNAKTVQEYETRRNEQLKLEAHYGRLAMESDKLLLMHAGRLGIGVDVRVQGQVEHQHGVTVIPEAVLPFLAGIREDVLRHDRMEVARAN